MGKLSFAELYPTHENIIDSRYMGPNFILLFLMISIKLLELFIYYIIFNPRIYDIRISYAYVLHILHNMIRYDIINASYLRQFGSAELFKPGMLAVQ